MSLNITGAFQRELQSFKTPPTKELSPVPQVGSQAPTSPRLQLDDHRPTLIVFLRHCGCPFAEKTFRLLSKLSTRHPSVRCVAVSHSSADATERWVVSVGGAWNVDVVIDEERDLYAAWGLGLSSTWHALSPLVLWSAYGLGKKEGIWNRETESGSRWQMGGAFGVDADGVVRWARVATSADDVPDLQAAVKVLEGQKETEGGSDGPSG